MRTISRIMEWISVLEYSPEVGEIVVAWLCDIEEPACLRFEVDEHGAIWRELVNIDRGDMSRTSRVSHWISLPKNPNEKHGMD